MLNKKSVAILLPCALLPGILTACSDDETKNHNENAPGISVISKDNSCDVAETKLATGSTTFTVKNEGDEATEFYVLSHDGAVAGEVSNIKPGDTRTLIVELQTPGSYIARCKPGMTGNGIDTDLDVTGDESHAAAHDAALTGAVNRYKGYVRQQVGKLQGVGRAFVAAVNAGDVERAKKLYPEARAPYERIEPVAEALPNDLDPRLDQREADLADGDEWSGFHKIEKDLWVSDTITPETKKTADQLGKDIQELNDAVNSNDFTITAVHIATGAQELLDEISTSKITGEEDVFSHTDLWDFQANLEGSRAAIDSLQNPLDQRSPGVVKKVNKRFDDVQKLLNKYREGSGFMSYDKVTDAQRKELSGALDHLTEAVSEVQGIIAQESQS